VVNAVWHNHSLARVANLKFLCQPAVDENILLIVINAKGSAVAGQFCNDHKFHSF
jgi:hypothetical protein